MGAFKNALKAIGDVAAASYENNQKIDDLTRQIIKHSYGIDPIEARKVAATLVSRAEPITWKY